MSATLLIDRTPRTSSRSFSHSGDSPIFTPAMYRPQYRPHNSGSAIEIEKTSDAGLPDSRTRNCGTRNERAKMALTSRATPTWLRQSGRFVVTSSSNTVSPPTSWMDSTARPTSVSFRASAFASTEISTNSLSQLRLIFMSRSELFQESEVVLEVELDIVDVVFQRMVPFDPTAKRESRVPGSVVSDIAVQLRIDHPGSHDFDPARMLADTATGPVTKDARDIHFGARFGKGEEAGPKPRFRFRSKVSFVEPFQGSFEI